MRKKLNCSIQQPDIPAAGSSTSWNQSNLLESLFQKPPETLEWTKESTRSKKKVSSLEEQKRCHIYLKTERGQRKRSQSWVPSSTARQILEDKCQCCQSLNFSETALIILMEQPWTMAAVWNPWSYCWCKCRARAKTAVPKLSLTATTGPQRHSCFAPGKCGGETIRTADAE